ncbi:MAG: 2'-5' RNA ligase family protein [Vicinamibacteria bacterium]
MRARGVSLWLVPEAGAGSRLAATIRELADELASPTFPPHVTLLAGLGDEAAAVASRAASLAAGFAPLSLRLTRVSGSPRFFRCLFLEVEAHPALLELRRRASAAVGLPPDPAFFPHLSLAYASLGAARRRELVQRLRPLAPHSIQLTRLEAWRTEGEAGAWRRLDA